MIKPGRKETKGRDCESVTGIKIDAAVEIVAVAVSSQLDAIFTFKEQRPAIKVFSLV